MMNIEERFGTELLDIVLNWIPDHFEPDDIFSENVLEKWALSNEEVSKKIAHEIKAREILAAMQRVYLDPTVPLKQTLESLRQAKEELDKLVSRVESAV